MAALNVEYINPFLGAATKILKDMCQVDVQIGKPFLREMKFTEDSLVIIIGVTGEMRGQVMIAFADEIARDVAGKMMMMPPLPQMDEIGASAIFEFLLEKFVDAVIYYDTDEKLTSVQKKLISLLSDNYKAIYHIYAEGKDESEKLYLRLLLVTDEICGMTDSYAKGLYQELSGIR